MKEVMRYGIILSLICVLSAGLLAGMNSLSKARILSQAQAEEEMSLKEVLPQGVKFEAIKSGNDIVYYKAYDLDGKFVGVAFKAEAKGYSSIIETMTGMSKDGQIIAMKILNQNETAGLGTRVVEPEFTRQFANRNIQDFSSVQAITGATISSRAVIDSVKKKGQEIKNLIKSVP